MDKKDFFRDLVFKRARIFSTAMQRDGVEARAFWAMDFMEFCRRNKITTMNFDQFQEKEFFCRTTEAAEKQIQVAKNRLDSNRFSKVAETIMNHHNLHYLKNIWTFKKVRKMMVGSYFVWTGLRGLVTATVLMMTTSLLSLCIWEDQSLFVNHPMRVFFYNLLLYMGLILPVIGPIFRRIQTGKINAFLVKHGNQEVNQYLTVPQIRETIQNVEHQMMEWNSGYHPCNIRTLEGLMAELYVEIERANRNYDLCIDMKSVPKFRMKQRISVPVRKWGRARQYAPRIGLRR